MSKPRNQSGPGARPRPAVTVAIGAVMALYGASVLLTIPAALESGSVVRARVIGPLAWIWTAGAPWRDWIFAGIFWVASAAFALGGICVILRRTWGMRVAIAALATYLLMVAVDGALMISLALGLVTFDAADPAFKHLSGPLTSLQPTFWRWALLPLTLETLAILTAFVWVRRVLAWERRARDDAGDCVGQ